MHKLINENIVHHFKSNKKLFKSMKCGPIKKNFFLKSVKHKEKINFKSTNVIKKEIHSSPKLCIIIEIYIV